LVGRSPDGPPIITGTYSMTRQAMQLGWFPGVREGKVPEAQEDAEAASVILDARKKAMEDIEAGRSAPYFAPTTTAPSQTGPTPSSANNKKKRREK
jgi:hypothetical protein